MTKHWRIVGYDSYDIVFDTRIPFGSLSEAEMKVLLARLQCRHLTDEEIVTSSLRRNARNRSHHIEVIANRGGRPGLMTTSTGIYYVATVE
ncbi:hypothetical protein V7S57_12685 [Caulobacter sp. CCNWLY153]|uniref:hypothetical protein n=1 Tax=unclassified Caulobacter TaxID=2648921 RepID=UPI002FF407AA